jgi:hypothetical protein
VFDDPLVVAVEFVEVVGEPVVAACGSTTGAFFC